MLNREEQQLELARLIRKGLSVPLVKENSSYYVNQREDACLACALGLAYIGKVGRVNAVEEYDKFLNRSTHVLDGVPAPEGGYTSVIANLFYPELLLDIDLMRAVEAHHVQGFTINEILLKLDAKEYGVIATRGVQ